MAPTTVAAIIDEATQLWTPSNDIEITLEANPTSVEIDRFRGFRLAGVNRVSIGVQALNDADLRRLGRTHGAKEALSAISLAQKIFNRTSFDLIYARQDQSLSDWQAELSEALRIADGHLSLYQLTVEPGTVFGARFDRGLLLGLPEEDLAADMYEMTQDLCRSEDYEAYEVSNHARAGAESQHNLIYWRCGDYVGIGPGAHGRLTRDSGLRASTVAAKMPGDWLAAVASGSGEVASEGLSKEHQATEFLLMGLRLTEGVRASEYAEIGHTPLKEDAIEELQELGLIMSSDDRIQTTLAGRMVLNSVLKRLLA
jgi:putative oxygen-independent coproporphyrinogen III oxidase